MSSNQFMIDASTRHQVFIQRFAGGEVKAIAKYLDRVEQELLSKLLKARTEFQVDRLQSQLKDVRSFIVSTYDQMGVDIVERANEFGVYEAEFARNMVAKGTSAVITDLALPATTQIIGAIKSRPMDLVVGTGKKKHTIKQALSSFSRKSSTRALDVIRDGFLTGETNLEITRKVQDILDVQRNQAATLTRTIINHTGNVARSEFYAKNDDVIEGEEWLSVLDVKTTLTCSKRDGNIYPVGSGPFPPANYNCRSMRVAKVNPKYNLGANIKGTRASKGSAGGQQVSTEFKYPGWFNKQADSFQKEYFYRKPGGKTKYKLFKEGKLKLTKFTDADGEPYSLKDLRRLEPQAFDRAGL